MNRSLVTRVAAHPWVLTLVLVALVWIVAGFTLRGFGRAVACAVSIFLRY